MWLLAAFVAGPLCAQPVSEYALKSALLFKLPYFIYRPSSDSETPLSFCVFGQNPFGAALERLAQSPVEGRSVRISYVQSAAALSSCEFVFISRSEAAGVDRLLRRLEKPVVTISDIEGFARAGGMVELALRDDGSAVNIVVNRRAAQRLNIEFNAQLLRLARMVEP